MQVTIPSDVWEKIKDFCTQKKTGQVVLDVKDGNVLGWKITEAGRVSNGVDTHLSKVV